MARDPLLFDAIFVDVLVVSTLGDFPAVIERAERGLALQPRNAALLGNRALALQKLGRADEARADFDKALEVAPDADAIRLFRAKFRIEVAPQDWPGAVDDLTRVLSKQPGFVDAHYLRGVALHNLGRFREAIEDYDAAERAAPQATWIARLRALREDARARAR